MQLYKRKGSSNWHVTWYDQDGKRYRKSLGTSDRGQAEGLAAKLQQDDFLQRHFGALPEVPFAEALLKYANRQKREDVRWFNHRTRYVLKRLAEWFGPYKLHEVTPTLIEDFFSERLGQVKRSTAQRDLATLRAVLYQAQRNGTLSQVPTFPKFKKENGRDRFLSQMEAERLVMAASPHLRPIIVLALETGARRGELLSLTWENVDLEKGLIVFRETKNGDDRRIRLSQRAKAALESVGPESSGVVFTHRSKAIKSIKTAFGTACRKAGLVDVRFHDLRHTFASRLVAKGVPLYDVKELLGHKSLQMVQRYAHLDPAYQERALSVLDADWHVLGTVGYTEPTSGSKPLENGAAGVN